MRIVGVLNEPKSLSNHMFTPYTLSGSLALTFDPFGVDFLKEIDHLKCKKKRVSALWQPLFLNYLEHSSAFLCRIFFLPFSADPYTDIDPKYTYLSKRGPG